MSLANNKLSLVNTLYNANYGINTIRKIIGGGLVIGEQSGKLALLY